MKFIIEENLTYLADNEENNKFAMLTKQSLEQFDNGFFGCFVEWCSEEFGLNYKVDANGNICCDMETFIIFKEKLAAQKQPITWIEKK